MPSKHTLTVELSRQKEKELYSSPEKYMVFLETAAKNYKYSFADQLLIYAQKPAATACAGIDVWNRLGRWVNKGTKGIALLVDKDGKNRLRYVFDLADTNSRYGYEVRLWTMRDEYKEQVIDSLENSFGEITRKQRFDGAVLNLADQVVSDNYNDYFDQLLTVNGGKGIIDGRDDEELKSDFCALLADSVAFQILTRCGYDAKKLFDPENFEKVKLSY